MFIIITTTTISLLSKHLSSYSFSPAVTVEWFQIQISALRPAALTEVIRGYPQSLQANAELLP
jgi:hypothetical protein